jgi:hypothetical protein
MNTSRPLVRTLIALAVCSAATMAVAQEPAPATGSSPPARFEAFNDGTVRDNETGLFWAAKDNGGNANWSGAQQYCQSLGAGWGLPTSDELAKLYLPDGAEGQACIGQLTCKVTPLIQLSGLTPWSSEANGAAEAWYVYFADGQKYAYKVDSSDGKRALCVRKP